MKRKISFALKILKSLQRFTLRPTPANLSLNIGYLQFSGIKIHISEVPVLQTFR